MTTPGDEFSELAKFAKLADQLDHALRQHPANTASASVTISSERFLSITVALIGFVAVVIAVASVLVVQAQRDADLRSIQQLQHEVEAIREKVDMATVYNTQQDKRLNILETKP